MRNLLSIIAVTVVSTFTLPVYVKASGIPVVDIAGNVDRRAQHLEQIAKWVEQINTLTKQKELLDDTLKELADTQTPLLNNQLTELVKQYQQMMTEYDHYLRMIKGIEGVISKKDYKRILVNLKMINPDNPLQGADVDIFTDEGFYDIDQQVARVFDRTKSVLDMRNDIVLGGLSAEDRNSEINDMRQHYRRSRLITSQMNSVKSIDNDMEAMRTSFDVLEQQRQKIATKGENQLETLQFIAVQNQAMIKNMELNQRIARDQLSYSNQLSSEYFANLAKAKQREIERLKKLRQQGPIPVNNTGRTATY